MISRSLRSPGVIWFSALFMSRKTDLRGIKENPKVSKRLFAPKGAASDALEEEIFILGNGRQRCSQPWSGAHRIHAFFDPFGAGSGDQVLALYPVSAYDTPWYGLTDVGSDFDVTCEVRSVALAAAGADKQPVWRYLFTHRFEDDPELNALGAFHRAELFFVFGTLQAASDNDGGYAPSLAELELSNRMMRYWARFAAHGDPNGLGPVHWRRYTDDRELMLELDDTTRQLAGYHIEQCNYLQTLPQP